MGKKKAVIMDASQEEELKQHSDIKYQEKFEAESESAYDLDGFEELEALQKREAAAKNGEDKKKDEKEKTTESKKIRVKKIRSKKYKALKKQVDVQKKYPLKEAVDKVLTLSKEKFDASVELHLVLKKDAITGSIKLPHGTGKSKKVVIFDDKIEKQIQSKNIDFDLLLAKKEDMPKIARYAKLLGPKGLMPNPKNKTVVTDPEKALKSFDDKTISFKTEKKAPLIHLVVGKTSFGADKLMANLQAVFTEINPKKLKKAAIATSMSPGVKLDLESIA